MGNYLRIARVYLRGVTAAVWCFLFLCLLVCLSQYREIAGNQAGILSGILSPKSYLAMFAYFNAWVFGAHLLVNCADPWASVLPQYRQKHLLVAAILALLFLGIPVLSLMWGGTSDIAPLSVATIFLTFFTAGLWTPYHPFMGFSAFFLLAFVFVPSSSSADFAEFLAGRYPSISVALIFGCLVAIGAFAWRLLALHEEKLAYQMAAVWGALFRGRRKQTFWGQFSNQRQEQLWKQWQESQHRRRLKPTNFDPLKNPFTNLKQVEELSGYRERSLWQRLQLWRLGTRPQRLSTECALSAGINLIACLPVFPARVALMFSVNVMNNLFLWRSWFNRRHRLGYESLRPRTRQEFVCELGLALLWDVIVCWVWGVLFAGIIAAIGARELLQVRNIVLFILGTGIGQLCVYALAIWLANGVWFAFTAICLWICLGSLMVRTVNGSTGIEVSLAVLSVLAATSVAAIPLAYHHLCRADLD